MSLRRHSTQRKARVVGIGACLAVGCSGAPRLPEEISFEGSRLDKANEWSMEDVSGVVFVPPGETLPGASLQIGIAASTEHVTSGDLHAWLMEKYRSVLMGRWFESETLDEGCKVGLPPGPPRPFVALHVCRSGPRSVACAEADERLDDQVVGRCLNRGQDCWDELCTQKWDQWRPALEALVFEVVDPR